MSTVATEVAEAEFNRFVEAMDLDVDVSKMDTDDAKAYAEAKGKIVGAIERGRLVVDEKGQPVYTTQDGTTITFYEPTGASFMATDGKKKEQTVAKMMALLADMTRKPAGTFTKLQNRDFRICQTIVTLFLG